MTLTARELRDLDSLHPNRIRALARRGFVTRDGGGPYLTTAGMNERDRLEAEEKRAREQRRAKLSALTVTVSALDLADVLGWTRDTIGRGHVIGMGNEAGEALWRLFDAAEKVAGRLP